MQTPFGITHYDGGVIDTQEQSSAGVVPLRQALARGKGEHLEIVAVRVTEIKRFDSSRVRVPVRQTLRTTRSMLNVEAPQPSVRCSHVAHDDGYVLEPSIVAARIDRNRATPGGQKLQQFNLLLAQAQPHGAHAQAENAPEMLVAVAGYLTVRDLLEGERAHIEIHSPLHVAHCHGDRFDLSNRWRGAGGERGIRATQEEYGERLGSRTQCRGRTLTPHRRPQFRPVREPDVRAGICEGARLRL